ncbi:hypothetical protein C5C23_06775 [Rathayibacter rathayi]|nr:hypothetical protein C5C23_06775 [Rathayibacter rathayi]PPI75824.1 hypothetical protein C5E03_12760 [Rathayibacter rathayi]
MASLKNVSPSCERMMNGSRRPVVPRFEVTTGLPSLSVLQLSASLPFEAARLMRPAPSPSPVKNAQTYAWVSLMPAGSGCTRRVKSRVRVTDPLVAVARTTTSIAGLPVAGRSMSMVRGRRRCRRGRSLRWG